MIVIIIILLGLHNTTATNKDDKRITKSKIIKRDGCSYRKCKICLIEKEISDFYKKGSSCKKCTNRLGMDRFNKRKNEFIKEIKNTMGGKCCNCGNDNIKHLCFHHINKDDKERVIGKFKSKKPMLEEASKCILLCHNCHLELHYPYSYKTIESRFFKYPQAYYNALYKSEYIKYKGGECEICGYNKCIKALHFHHKDPAKKEFKLSVKVLKPLNDIIKSEIDKCSLLCANHHMEIHS